MKRFRPALDCSRLRSAITCVSIGALLCACARQPSTTVTPLRLNEEYCWWAVLRSARKPDSVAAMFARAFRTSGFSTVNYKKSADTARAIASPTEFYPHRATIASRAVAYWHGDSTHFRYFVAVGPPTSVSLQTTDSLDSGKLLLDMCARIARAAAIGWSAPRSPTGDEELSVWKRTP
jgi:hypothetical protein